MLTSTSSKNAFLPWTHFYTSSKISRLIVLIAGSYPVRRQSCTKCIKPINHFIWTVPQQMQLFPPQPIRESCSDDANVIFGHGCKRIKIADTNSFDHITCLMRSIPISPRTNSILLSLLETAMVNLLPFGHLFDSFCEATACSLGFCGILIHVSLLSCVQATQFDCLELS